MYLQKTYFPVRNANLGLFGDMPDLLERVFQEAGDSAHYAPAIDFEDRGDHYLVAADLPGVRPEDVDIRLAEDWLHIEGERGTVTPADDAQRRVHFAERALGTFHRALRLPADVDADAIEAHGSHGVLHIRLGKKAEVQPRRIAVKPD